MRGRAERVRSAPASDINLLSNREGVIDLHAQVSDGALDLGMAKEKLYRP